MGVIAFSKLSWLRVVISLSSQADFDDFNSETLSVYGRKSPMRDGVVKLFDLKAEHLVEAEVRGRGIKLARC